MNNILVLRGDKPLYGRAVLSGDSYSAINLVTTACSQKDSKIIDNVVRSNILLSYLDLLQEIGIKYQWLSYNTIEIISVDGLQRETVVGIQGDKYKDYYKLLIPIYLSHFGVSFIDSKDDILREEVGFYEKSGFTISRKYNSYELIKSYDTSVSVVLDGSKMDIYTLIARNLMSVLFQNVFSLTNLKLNSSDYINRNSFEIGSKRYLCKFNHNEFMTLLGLSVFAKNEIVIEGYDSLHMMPLLGLYSNIAIEYEISGQEIKIWPKRDNIKETFTLETYDLNYIGIFLLIISAISKSTTRVIVLNNKNILKLVQDLNMLGTKILIEKSSNENYLILTVKSGNVVPAKNVDLNTLWGYSLIVAACISGGVNHFLNYPCIEDESPNLLDNLSNINVDLNRR